MKPSNCSKQRRLSVSDLIVALKVSQQEGIDTIVIEDLTCFEGFKETFSQESIIESVAICPSKDNQNMVLYIKNIPTQKEQLAANIKRDVGLFSSLFSKNKLGDDL